MAHELSGQYLYVMTVPSGYIKVGITANEANRLAQIQSANPEVVSIFSCIDPEHDGIAARELEQSIHQFFRAVRAQGEWFKATPEMAAHAIKVAWAKAAYPTIYYRWQRRYARQAEQRAKDRSS
jgi:hypothetical protein